MTSKLRRALAMLLCAMLLTIPAALAQEEETQGAVVLPDDDFADFVGEEAETGEEADVNVAGDPDVNAAPLDQYTTGDEPSSIDSALPVTSVGSIDTGGKDVTKNCRAKVSEGSAQNMVDRKMDTAWAPKQSGAKLEIELPSGKSASGLYIEWGTEPTAYTLMEVDKSGEVISTRTEADSFPCLKSFFAISADTVKIRIQLPKTGHSIIELFVVANGGLPPGFQNWSAPHDKAEVMVVSALFGDEFLFFGGVLPYYQVEKGIATQVVYVCGASRSAKDQALAALWEAGIRNYPVFLDFDYKNGITANDAIRKWGEDNATGALVAQIRRFKPGVIVSNSAAGEKNDGARAATAQLIQAAVTRAPDDAYEQVSKANYGTWTPSKLYLHLSDQNPITMNWSTVSAELNNTSPLEVASKAYGKYTSLTSKNPFQAGGEYDNSQFGLVYTDVGVDAGTSGADFLENLSTTGGFDGFDNEDVNFADDTMLDDENLDAAADLLTLTPEPSPTPEPTPEPSPTPEPTGFGIKSDLTGLKVFLIVLIVLAVLIGGGIGANIILKQRGIDLQIYRRVNRVLHGKSFKLPQRNNKVYREAPKDVEPEYEDDDEGEDDDVF